MKIITCIIGSASAAWDKHLKIPPLLGQNCSRGKDVVMGVDGKLQ
jgi:hypothetical protein